MPRLSNLKALDDIDITFPSTLVDLTWIDFDGVKNHFLEQLNKLGDFNFTVIEKKKDYRTIYNIKEPNKQAVFIMNSRTDISFYGVILSLLKNCRVMITDISSVLAELAVLNKIPLITYFNHPINDINEMNPLNVSVFSLNEKLENLSRFIGEKPDEVQFKVSTPKQRGVSGFSM